MARPRWFIKLIELTFPRNPAFARITYLPYLGKYLERKFFRDDDLIVLPRDKVIEIGKKVKKQKDIVLPSQVAHHFVDEAEHHWMMDTCICRRVMKCKDYPVDLGCLFMGQAATEISPEDGHRVTRDEAHEHLRRCREAGLVHIIGRAKFDTVWLGVGPDHKFLSLCSCCPCCCVARGIAYSAPVIQEKLSRMPGVTVKVTEDCNGCGACINQGCFANALSMRAGRAVISSHCRGCGRCADICPEDAIKVTFDKKRSIEATVDRINKWADLK